MADNDYIPSKDAQFSLWAQAFSNGISATPALYMLTPAQAATIAGTVTSFVNALLVANDESTRTKPTIIAKDNARSICETMCRQYAIDIKFNEGIADEDKVAIGVRPINPDREPIEVPTTQPLLNVTGETPGVQTVRYADSNTPNLRAKPFGAASLQLYVGITADEPAPIASCQFRG